MDQSKNLSTIKRNIPRTCAVIVAGDKVLLMHRRNRGKEYYTFIGGGIENDEAPETALVREVQEEASVEVVPIKLLYTMAWENEAMEYFFLADFVSGVPHLSPNSIEKEVMEKDLNQFYEPLWVEVKDIPDMLLYPLEIRDMFLEDLKEGFSADAQKIALARADARQTI
jgi:8-oxo-dGTP pyrophosphatase MutT (NUDIX family)